VGGWVEAHPKLAAQNDGVGATFGELHARMLDAVPIGIHAEDGTIVLNPTADTRIAEGDEILVLAADDDTYDLTPTIGQEVQAIFDADQKGCPHFHTKAGQVQRLSDGSLTAL
jgi:K+/H+ antiporter YhaU regulatory subunit KhtT